MALPKAFNPRGERVRIISSVKKRASNNFKLTKQESLRAGLHLALWLYVAEREDEALEVCKTVGRSKFTGNFNLWSWVERALVLQSRILRNRGSLFEAHIQLKRVKDAGFVPTRLEGSLFSHDEIQNALAGGNAKAERDWRLGHLSEVVFVRELGGSPSCPPEALERDIAETVARLRILAKL